MDNRELNLAIPETGAESLASGDGIGPEDEDESDIRETLEYVAFRPCSYTIDIIEYLWLHRPWTCSRA